MGVQLSPRAHRFAKTGCSTVVVYAIRVRKTGIRFSPPRQYSEQYFQSSSLFYASINYLYIHLASLHTDFLLIYFHNPSDPAPFLISLILHMEDGRF